VIVHHLCTCGLFIYYADLRCDCNVIGLTVIDTNVICLAVLYVQ